VTVAAGAVTVTVRPVTVTGGVLSVTTGAVTVTVRPVTVTGGVLTVTAGPRAVTVGPVTVTGGAVTVWAGAVSVLVSTLVTTAVGVVARRFLCTVTVRVGAAVVWTTVLGADERVTTCTGPGTSRTTVRVGGVSRCAAVIG
jgi:hypothetical protein